MRSRHRRGRWFVAGSRELLPLHHGAARPFRCRLRNPVTPQTLFKLVLLLGVVLLVAAIGIRTRLEQPLLLLRRPALALRAMAAMYVALPAFVLLLVWLMPLREGVGAVLLGFAVSPVLPPWAKKGVAVGGRGDYVIGLQVLSCVVSLLVVPLMILIAYRIFGVRANLAPLAVERVLLVTVAVPLALGLGVARLWPGAAPRLAGLAERVGGVVLLLGTAMLLLLRGQWILGVLGQGTLLLTVAVVGFGLLVGFCLGGPDRRLPRQQHHRRRHGAALPARLPLAPDPLSTAAPVGEPVVEVKRQRAIPRGSRRHTTTASQWISTGGQSEPLTT
jgi:BASS family bile acid:Na+ symporter